LKAENAIGRRSLETKIDQWERANLKREYIPELSEVRMMRRAPEKPFNLSAEDARYIETSLRNVEMAFGITAFPGVPFGKIPGRALIAQFIDWWRGLEPEEERQSEALARLPGAIRLLDTVSAMMEEQALGERLRRPR
jgi:hypothetical protein